MKTYSTYQSCKIENPECEIAEYISDDFKYQHDKFTPVVKDKSKRCGYAYADSKTKGSPNITDGFWKICNPADYCMTVEEFLKSEYKLANGDLVIGVGGWGVLTMNGDKDDNELDANDKNRYILRAAALEKTNPDIHKDSEFYRKPRTKVEFVKVEDSIWHLETDFKCGEIYNKSLDCSGDFVVISSETVFLACAAAGNLYRRVETPMTEREAFIDEAMRFTSFNTQQLLGQMFDSGKFKLVN